MTCETLFLSGFSTANDMEEPVRVARNAMATRFEIALHGENPVALRAAAEEALEEIEGL